MQFSTFQENLDSWLGASLIFGVLEEEIASQLENIKFVINPKLLLKKVTQKKFKGEKAKTLSFEFLDQKLETLFIVGLGKSKDLNKSDIENSIGNLVRKTVDKNEKIRVQIKRAKWFTNQLIKLGSAFIKIGQLLSARPDLIPNTWIQELSKLQDQVPNFSFAQVEETIRNELGSKFNEIDQIICDPVGSASLAQVHRATLKDGKK